jgi:hypothetical protein
MTAPYTTHRDFFFKTPLYEKREVSPLQIKQIIWVDMTFDGYCPYCRKETTFDRNSYGTKFEGRGDKYFMDLHRIAHINFKCARQEDHIVHFYWRDGREGWTTTIICRHRHRREQIL